MDKKKFIELWNLWSEQWLRIPIEDSNGVVNAIGEYCEMQSSAVDIVFKNYCIIKNLVKSTYFEERQHALTLNRYKRAAVIAYAVIKTEPIVLCNTKPEEDPLFLKQRFAFFLALGSIVQDFPIEQVREKKLFSVMERIGERNCRAGNDAFLLSIYKDLFFAELYGNYNVLSMANIFGLLIEDVIGLSETEKTK